MENNLFLYTLLKGVRMKYNDLTGHDHSNGGTVISQSQSHGDQVHDSVYKEGQQE